MFISCDHKTCCDSRSLIYREITILKLLLLRNWNWNYFGPWLKRSMIITCCSFGGREGGGHSTILCNPKLFYTRLFLVTHIAGCEVDLDATRKRSISFYWTRFVPWYFLPLVWNTIKRSSNWDSIYSNNFLSGHDIFVFHWNFPESHITYTYEQPFGVTHPINPSTPPTKNRGNLLLSIFTDSDAVVRGKALEVFVRRSYRACGVSATSHLSVATQGPGVMGAKHLGVKCLGSWVMLKLIMLTPDS